MTQTHPYRVDTFSMPEFDLVIKNGYVISGAGNPWFKADVGILDGVIAKISIPGIAEDSHKVINANDLFVAPGFIDTHSHYTFQLLKEPSCEPLVKQGITTALLGQDGFSAAPIYAGDENFRRYLEGLEGEIPSQLSWDSLDEYFHKISSKGVAINVATLVGHGNIRNAVKGFNKSKASKNELEKMGELVGVAMNEGAFGMSTGLIYPPSMFGDTEEIIELARIVKRFCGIYVSHIRGEGNNLIQAVNEAIKIGKESGLPVHISHHKALGEHNRGKIRETIEIIDKARNEGLDITADHYPYTAGSTMFTALVPPWLLEGGTSRMLERLADPELRERARFDCEHGLPDWETYANISEKITVSFCKATKDIEGKTLDQVASERGNDPIMTIFDILAENDGIASCVVFQQDEEDMRNVMRSYFTNFCTDGLATGKPHPRSYGTFPRVLGRYVREYKTLVLEEAIRKMTSLPAQRLGLRDRGFVAEGMVADIVVFDRHTVLDMSKYEDPFHFPKGIDNVIVGGKLVVEDSHLTGELPGKIMLGPGHESSSLRSEQGMRNQK